MGKKKLLFAAITVVFILGHSDGVTFSGKSEIQPVTITSVGMINGVIAAGTDENGNYGKSVSNALFSYNIGYGKVDAENDILDCNAYEISNGGLRTKAVYNSANYNSSVLLTSGTARVTNFYYENASRTAGNFNIIYRIIAVTDESIIITHGSRNNAANNLYANIYKKNGAVVTLLQSKEIPTGDVAVNSLGGTFELLEGEELIYEFALVSEALVDRVFYGDLFPTFNATENMEAFPRDKSALISTLQAEKESLNSVGYRSSDLTSIETLYDTAMEDVENAETRTHMNSAAINLDEKITAYLKRISGFVGYWSNNKLYSSSLELTIENCTEIRAVYLDFSMKNGASIRMAQLSDSGIRFVTEYKFSQEIVSDCYKCGTLIVPTSYLKNKNLTFEDFPNTDKIFVEGATALNIKINKELIYQQSGKYCYNTVMINIYSHNYDKAFSARSYIQITYEDNTKTYFYTPYSEDNNSRCVKNIAIASLADTSMSYTQQQLSILNTYAGN